MFNKFWEWMNTVQTYDGWTPLQALVFMIIISPFLYIIWLVA